MVETGSNGWLLSDVVVTGLSVVVGFVLTMTVDAVVGCDCLVVRTIS